MKRGRRPQFPSVVVLKTAPQTDAASLSEAFGQGRRTIHYWRSSVHKFPKATRHGNASLTSTAEIASWCDRHGIKLIWV